MDSLEIAKSFLMVIGLFTLMGGFCLVLFLPLGIGLYITYLKDKQARALAEYVSQPYPTIPREAQDDMDTLTAQFRTHINEQTKQYRTSQPDGKGETRRTQGSHP